MEDFLEMRANEPVVINDNFVYSIVIGSEYSNIISTLKRCWYDAPSWVNWIEPAKIRIIPSSKTTTRSDDPTYISTRKEKVIDLDLDSFNNLFNHD